ncbi:hypothetical protein HBB16_01840 [Pseudonocardia sp. MCCB 268]|nr:hypothetical protein [Pseudonocardia cytotoxica]
MFDQAGLVRELVKWDYELRDARQVEDVVDRAVSVAESHLARAGLPLPCRAGPPSRPPARGRPPTHRRAGLGPTRSRRRGRARRPDRRREVPGRRLDRVGCRAGVRRAAR